MHMTNPIEALEAKLEEVDTDRLDGADIIGVLMLVADHEEIDLLEFLNTRYATDLIEISQSNYARSLAIITEWAKIDRQISDAQDEEI